jgi:predicted Rossmann-fold nucleotide-binding protein
VVLPGGVGSFDEFFDALSQAKIGVFQKKFGILNIKNYYDPLLSQLNRAVEVSFMKKNAYDAIQVETTASALFNVMNTHQVHSIDRYAKGEALLP